MVREGAFQMRDVKLSRTLPLLALLAAGARAQGWEVSGPGAAGYDVAPVAPGVCSPGAGRLRSNGKARQGPVAVLQTFQAAAYRGARVRLEATLDLQGAGVSAGLVFSAEGPGGKVLVFEDQRRQPLAGPSSCTVVQLEALVPAEAELLTVGVRVEGEGTLEFSDLALTRAPAAAAPQPGAGPAIAGRVGEVVFTEAVVSGTAATGRPVAVTRGASGAWRDPAGTLQGSLLGRKVRAHYLEVRDEGADGFGNRNLPVAMEGDFELTHEGGVTIIEGQYGNVLGTHLAQVTLAPGRLDLRWGSLERHLVLEAGREVPPGCRSYASGPGPRADRLLVCGAALGADPPPVQTVLAFLAAGFRPPGEAPTLRPGPGRLVTH